MSTGGRSPTVLATDRARLLGLVGALALLGLAAGASVLVGTVTVRPGDVWHAYRGWTGTDTDLVVVHLRVPRTITGLLVGVALGLAGTVIQGATRNPLADPSILGISAGAALGSVTGITVFGVTSLGGYVWFAFAGAALAGIAVHVLASAGRIGATPVKLALSGAAVSVFLGSVTAGAGIIDVDLHDRFRFWSVGSLGLADREVTTQLAPFVVAGVVLAVVSGRSLDALALGEDVARSLGQRVALARTVAATSVVLLAGAATAAVGPVAFVGLTAPHAARILVGPGHRWVLPWAAVLAAVLVLGADVVGRVVVQPRELQVGLVTAAFGAPWFVALVRRRRLAQL
ncbi:MAG: FecCD family ABC transporter permease [Acidimicrobiia bacterium]